MRTFKLSFLLFTLFCSCYSSAAVNYYWNMTHYGRTGPTPGAICMTFKTPDQPDWPGTWAYTNGSKTQAQCYGSNGQLISNTNMLRVGDSCSGGRTYSPTTGGCECPSGSTWNQPAGTCDVENTCATKAGQSTSWRAEYASLDAYNQNPIRCTTSQGGCKVDVCSSGSHTCQQDGRSGMFVCTGQGGTFTGDMQQASEGDGVDGCEGPACEPSPPQTSGSDKECTAPTASNGVTTYTCVTESNANQWADSDCAVGEVNGVQGLHCTSPDYVPESNDKTKTDNVSETNNADGGKTTTTESTTDQTKCKAGNCTSTSTTTNTTTTTNGNGQTTGESSTCTGDRCDDPSTPGKDESEEDEEEPEEVERTASGDNCSDNLQCEGDAIDCAILRQQKAMRCSLDWDTHKGAVLSEASKPEYRLQELEVDAGSLFNGPSASRWLGSSCPADRSIYLETIKRSVSLSWSPVCQYADAMGYMIVFGATLFFAVYVGRAFGGD